jgi:hypothetical protein
MPLDPGSFGFLKNNNPHFALDPPNKFRITVSIPVLI